MNTVQVILDFIKANWSTIATILFLTSEMLGETDKVKASSIFGLVVSLLKPAALKKIAEEENAANAASTPAAK